MARRHVIVIMSDEHDPRILGCAGHAIAKTPHIDALAARGLRFAHAYTPSPICVPARAAFATGLRVHQTGHWDNAMPYTGTPRGWGHVLQREGIRVESIGKLHYRADEDPAGFDREHIPMHVVGGHGMVWASIRDPYVRSPSGQRMLGPRVGAGESSYTQYDREVAARAVAWIRDAGRRPDERFALYIGFVAPHFPLIAPQAFFDLYPPEGLPAPKLQPQQGYRRHPWVQAYADFMRNEESFTDAAERQQACAAYFGLCSFLDHHVGSIVQAVEDAGLAGDTTLIYTSDHGDNLGARGLWGKSTLYQESVGVPMILAGPDVPQGVCATPVDLLDLYPTLLEGVGLQAGPEMAGRPGRSLFEIASAAPDPERVVFSEYHAAGSNSAGFMLRKGRWKLHYYVGHRPELFDLERDPEELQDLAPRADCAAVLAAMETELRRICDPEAVDARAKADQRALIERHGGAAVAATLGAGGATPAPLVFKADADAP
ncbi:MAG: sulfatase-like hydrolase/transferase [Burkholderiales bacterium]|nr:sulfatase-like hydrolase/transferase [Burkholderiales bacterium]MDE1926485.1 sulfatase-like hydrolase/transferase [Burkholderiales bacterium]MDE2159512.1 sulfatase-like hydrolase/transferase [Burkholderiales bacterium]MDE2504398.1 sulfatase-like hydrolase/transferase [Burkholderiales bacterium]